MGHRAPKKVAGPHRPLPGEGSVEYNVELTKRAYVEGRIEDDRIDEALEHALRGGAGDPEHPWLLPSRAPRAFSTEIVER